MHNDLANDAVQCIIDPESGEIVINDSRIRLRPKTFQLLLLLARAPHKVFSKADIFASVWPDTVVEDQVIFQSINEIRKTPGLADAITTFPRRGYRWSVRNTTIATNPPLKQPAKPPLSPKHLWSALFLICCLLVAGTYFYKPDDIAITKVENKTKIPSQTQSQEVPHQAVLILPFEVASLEDDNKWLRFGAMEGLIKTLTPSNHVTVFQLEDSIDILNRLPAEDRNNPARIFAKSGASLILRASISGVPGDINIVYTVFQPHTATSNTVHATNVNDGVAQLASVFEDSLGEQASIDPQVLNKQFQNDLISKAVQFLEINDAPSALAFLESAVVTDKDNIFALYLLAKVALSQGHLEQAISTADMALNSSNLVALAQYQNRLYYLKGGAMVMQSETATAEQLFKQAEQHAQSQKDWLYYSYTQSMLGKVKQRQQDYDQAHDYFIAALTYQELLQCPMGIAQGHLDLAEYHHARQEPGNAMRNYRIAEALIRDKQLTQAEPVLALVKSNLGF